MNYRIIVLVVTAFLLMVGLSPAKAIGVGNARATAMAGAYTSLAKGYYCPSFNPANLGLAANRMNGLQVLGFGLAVRNNSLSLKDYNNYTGAYLSEADKQELLSKIPAEGLQVSGDGEVNFLGFCRGSMVVSVSAMGAGEFNMPREVMELLLNGNSFAEAIDLSGMYGEGYWLGAMNLSYGRRLYESGDRQLSAGATFRYLKGLGYEEIIEADGRVVTLSSGLDGDGTMVSRTASGGNGYALDLGAALQINEDYTVGATLFNFLSGINWTKETEEHLYTFSFDTVTLVNMDEDSMYTSDDTTYAIGSFATHLPSIIKVGLAKTSGKLLWAVDWEQGFKKAAGSSASPRFSAGGEYHLLNYLPVRAGLGIGGRQGTTVAGGFGLDFSLFHIDLAAANYSAVIGSSGKGINFAINGGFRF